ncbi:retropepsin-like aspartic protease family protein [Roseibium aggregatum]|uniref:TIGR02281 family clan AA aspartic protease n=1 Tax=Roseibium aggregatum TaxID=187304 RepID=A0A939J033_9HYPH|nr:TIGR02281 family clan AA aspartic protease [Roseibium aggregatum]MBN9668848.1 TIGR02281 family clan AA aspartic protease [Roseibium aggregatum]
MFRFVVVLLVCAGAAPFVPDLIEGYLSSGADGDPSSSYVASSGEDAGERIHRISKSRDGHFYTEVRLNGRRVDMLVDTGATVIALPEDVAEDIGIFLQPSDYKYQARTANGVTRVARTMVDEVRIGDIRLKDVEASVLEGHGLGQPLLGMSVFNKLERFDISDGTLLLVQ